MRFLNTPNRRSVAKIAISASVGQGITFVFLPVVSRIFDPAEFGAFGIYAAVVGIGTIVATARLEFALPLAKSDRDLQALIKIIFLVTFTVSTLVALTAILWGKKLEHVMAVPGLQNVAILTALGIAVFAIFQVALFVALRTKNYAGVAVGRLVQGGSLGPMQSLVGAISRTADGLAVGQILSHLFGSIFLLRDISLPLFRAKGGLSGLRATLSSYARFPLFSMPAALANAATLRAPAVLLVAYFGPVEAGSFVFCQSVLSGPVMLIGRSIGQVYLSELSYIRRTVSTGASRLLWGLTFRLLIVGVLAGVLLHLYAPILFRVIFGESWSLAGSLAAILAIVVSMEIVIIPITQTLDLLEKQSAQLAWDLCRLLCVIGIFLYADRQGWVLSQAITAYSLALFTFYVVLLVIMGKAAKKHDRSAKRQS